MIPRACVVAAGVAALLAGPTCSATSDAPALITKPTAESRAEVARVVSQALNGVAVPLADDALVRENTLVVERARPRAIDGAPVPGRENRRPDHFRLVKNGKRCVLVHEESGRRFTLPRTTCAPR
jgi:hypothetical protein